MTQFEKDALAKFLQGEDMVAKASVNKIEMVGSLRAIDQCTKCHDVKRGALLGAFSYELRRDPALPVDELPEPKQAEIF